MSQPLLNQILHELQDIRGTMATKEEFKELDRRMDGLDRRMDGLDRRMDGLTTKEEFEELDRRIDGLATKEEFEELDRRIDGLATKEEFKELDRRMDGLATKEEFTDLRSTMEAGFLELRQLIGDHHKENILVDEKLLRGIRTTNDKLDEDRRQNMERFSGIEHSINVLNRNQLRLETEIEKLKHTS